MTVARDCRIAIHKGITIWAKTCHQNFTLLLTPEVVELLKQTTKDLADELFGRPVVLSPDIRVSLAARKSLKNIAEKWSGTGVLDFTDEMPYITSLLKGVHKSKLPFGTLTSLSTEEKQGMRISRKRRSPKKSRSHKK